MAKYKCKVCGYIHEGNKAPDVCPVCAAPASDFEEMKDEAAADKKKGLDRDSNVYTVVYASVMVVLVAVVLAFTSQSLRTFQQKNEENDKRQQILRSINVTVPANEAEAKYSELIKEAFLVNETVKGRRRCVCRRCGKGCSRTPVSGFRCKCRRSDQIHHGFAWCRFVGTAVGVSFRRWR